MTIHITSLSHSVPTDHHILQFCSCSSDHIIQQDIPGSHLISLGRCRTAYCSIRSNARYHRLLNVHLCISYTRSFPPLNGTAPILYPSYFTGHTSFYLRPTVKGFHEAIPHERAQRDSHSPRLRSITIPTPCVRRSMPLSLFGSRISSLSGWLSHPT